MSTGLTFDSNSLQTASILTNDIDHFSGPNKDQQIFALSHGTRSVIPYVDWPGKTITISGALVGSSITNLDALIDTFKSYFTGKDKNLDIDYNGGTRRYIATAQTPVITRPGGLAYATFSVVFDCTYPWGYDTSTTSALTASARTSSAYTDAYTFLGTAPYQLAITTITLLSMATSATNIVSNPDFEVNTTGWSSGGIGTFTRVTTQHNSGVAAGQMVNAASSPLTVPVANTYGWELINLSGLTAGVKYTVSLWLKGNAGGESVGVETLGSALTTTALTTSWQQVIFTFTATATTDQLYVFSTTASATWFIDDVSILASGSAYIQWGNNTNGQAILVQRAWSVGDVLIIDCAAKTVTVNGLPVSFSGAFPQFPPGAQTLFYADTFNTRSFNISSVYTKAYI